MRVIFIFFERFSFLFGVSILFIFQGNLLSQSIKLDGSYLYYKDEGERLYSKAENFFGKENDTCLHYLKKAKINFELAKDTFRIIDCNNFMSVLYYYSDEYDNAFEILDSTEKKFPVYLKENTYSKIEFLNSVAALKTEKGDLFRGLELFNSIYQIEKELNDTILDIRETVLNLSIVYFRIGDFQQSIFFADEILRDVDISMSVDDFNIINALAVKAISLKSMKTFEEAKILFFKILGLLENDDSFFSNREKINCYHELIDLYTTEQKLDSAKHICKKAYDLHRSANLEYKKFRTESLLAKIYLAEKNYKQAKKHFERGLNLLIGILGEKNAKVAIFYSNIGNLFKDKGELRKALSLDQKAIISASTDFNK
jgi:tetratricopeptide (TPR) repeat protein